MKKNQFFAITLLALGLGATSCSKTYNCHCIYKDNGNVTNEMDHKISEGSKEKSAASCDEMDATTTTTLNGNTTVSTIECEITE